MENYNYMQILLSPMTEADETHWIIALIGSEIYFHWRSVRMVEVQIVEGINKSVTICDQEFW